MYVYLYSLLIINNEEMYIFFLYVYIGKMLCYKQLNVINLNNKEDYCWLSYFFFLNYDIFL